MPFNDEVAYIQSKLTNLIGQADGSFAAPEINSFSAYFQQHGGWWKTTAELESPGCGRCAWRVTFRWKRQNLPVKVILLPALCFTDPG